MVRFSNNGSNSTRTRHRAARSTHSTQTAGRARSARRQSARRREILGAAARAFRDRGFAATGMREIASEADLSTANLYHYFRGKHEILYFCQEASLDRLLATLQAVRRSSRPSAGKLRDVIAAHIRCLLGELEGATAHLDVEDLPTPLKRRIIARRDRYERGIRRLVADGVAAGEFVECDAELVTRAMLGAANWTARWFRPQGTCTPAAVGTAFADYLVRGLEAGRSPRNGRGRR
jgi:AcrR family transcriptional regulator